MRRRKNVLVVDDSPVNLSILEEILDDEYLVTFAHNGPEAIRLAAKHHPDVILLDVMMPKMDGLEVCHRLRATADLRDTVIIMVSAKAMPSERAAGINAGANDYITKPFDEVELLSILRRYAGAHVIEADDVGWDESDDETSVVR